MTDINEAYAQLEAVRARAEKQLEEARRRHEDLARATAEAKNHQETVHSARGEVAVTAQAGGRIVSVVFADSARNVGSVELSRIVTDTIARAQHQASSAAVEMTAVTMGEGSPFVQNLRESVQASFPDPAGHARNDENATRGGLL